MAKKKVKQIVSSPGASGDFLAIMEYLSENAPNALDIVGNAIIDRIESLESEYNHYPPDRLRKNNDSIYKATLVYSYQISYQNTSNVNILRIRHTSREPLNYY